MWFTEFHFRRSPLRLPISPRGHDMEPGPIARLLRDSNSSIHIFEFDIFLQILPDLSMNCCSLHLKYSNEYKKFKTNFKYLNNIYRLFQLTSFSI